MPDEYKTRAPSIRKSITGWGRSGQGNRRTVMRHLRMAEPETRIGFRYAGIIPFPCLPPCLIPDDVA